MIRKIGVVVIIALGLVFAAKGQTPSSTFVYTINGDTCAPSVPNSNDSMYATFTANPFKSGITYSWTFGSSGVAAQTGPNVDVYFKKSGTFTVTLTATNSLGNSSSTSKTVTIKCRPTISYAISDSMGCSPLTVTLTASSTGCTGTDKFSWYVGGLKYRGSSFSKTYTALGYYHPSLDINDTFSNGCVASFHKDTFIRVTPKPAITFTATPASSCSSPDTVTYTNTTSGGFGTYNPHLNFTWTFTGGSPSSSNLKSPKIVYTTTGTYDAKLVAVNPQSGCADSLTKTSVVTVLSAPTSSVTASSTTACQCGSFTLTWTGTPTPSNVTWSNTCGITIPTGTSVTVAVPCSGTTGACTFTGTPTYSNGCSAASKGVSVTIVAKPVTHYTVSDTVPGCKLPRSDTFTAKSTSGATYNWLITPGPCIKTTGAGTNQFVIIYGCPGKYRMPVLNEMVSGCANQYQDTNSIEIDSMKAVISTTTSNIFSGACAPIKVKFISSQSLGKPAPNYFKWVLRDSSGTIDTSAINDSLIYKFRQCGSRFLTLYIKNSLGCTDTVKDKLLLGMISPAVITLRDSFRCYHDTISFNTNTVFSCKPVGLVWYMDWPKYTLQGFGNKFTVGSLDTGFHRVALVTSNNGCLDTIVDPYRIQVRGPKIRYRVTPSCTTDVVQVDVGKKAGSILSKTILWRNNINGTYYNYLKNDTTIYDTLLCGNRNFQIYFIDTLGTRVCIDSLPFGGSLFVLHRHLTMADTLLSGTTSCYPYNLKIKNSSSSCGVLPDVSIYYVKVYKDCGIGSYKYYTSLRNSLGGYYKSGDTITTSGLLPGRYKFTVVGLLSGYGYSGCVDSVKIPSVVTIYGVKAGFKDVDTITTGCGPLSVSLVDTSSSTCNLSTITAYRWNIYVPGSSTQIYDSFTVKTPPTLSLSKPGCYSVSYKITDNHGCVDSALSVSYLCVVKPAVSFTVSQDSVCGSVKLSFTSTASLAGSSKPLSYVWNFGNGDTTHAQSPTYTYIDSSLYGGPSYKLYHVTLDVSTGTCDSVFEHDVYVTFPKIDLTIIPSTPQKCPPVFATFICKSPKDALIYDWFYDYPNPSTEVVTTAPSDTIYPVYDYPGTYDVFLTVITRGGCVDTVHIKKAISIDGPTLSTKSVTPKIGCSPLTVQLKAYAAGPIKYQWKQTKDSLKVNSPGDSINFVYTARGKFLAYVIVTDTIKHCSVKYPLDTITIGTPTAKFTLGDSVGCSGSAIQFSDSSSTATYLTAHKWNFGDGTTGTGAKISHVFTSTTPTFYTIKLVTTSYPGCKDSTTHQVHIYPLPVPKIYMDDSNVCPGTVIHFTDTSSGIITSRKWNYGTGSTFTGTKYTSHLYDTAGTYSAKLIVVAGTGCSDSSTRSITVYPLPPVKAGADTSICIGTFAYLHASGASTYIWHYIASTDSTKSNPNVSPTVTTRYYLIGTDVHECVDTASIKVTVNTLPVVSLGPDLSLCVNDSILLIPTVTGGAIPYKYAWSPGSVLSTTTGATAYAKPLKTARISIIVTDTNRCRNYDTMLIKVNPLPVIMVSKDTGVCIGFCASLLATGASKYVWTPGPDSTAAYIVCPTPAGIYTYNVVGIDSNNCRATNHVIVTVHPKPSISAGADQTICRGDTIALTGSGGAKYVWSPNDSTVFSDSAAKTKVKPLVNSTYTVTGTDVYGCVNTGSVQIFVIQPVEALVQPTDTTVCFNKPFLAKASGGIFYKWYPVAGLSNPFDSATVITLKKDGNFIVIVSNQCFADSATITVHVQPLPSVVVTPHNSFITTGESVTLTATGSSPGVYSWLPNTGIVSGQNTTQIIVSPQTNTTYTVTFGSGPCIVTDSGLVTLKCASFRFPNLFTPDEAQNNYFHPIGVSLSEITSFRVYDRWGNMMYSTTDKTDKGWDGTHNGGKCEQGVYVYYIEAVCTNGEIIRTQGNITLLR